MFLKNSCWIILIYLERWNVISALANLADFRNHWILGLWPHRWSCCCFRTSICGTYWCCTVCGCEVQIIRNWKFSFALTEIFLRYSLRFCKTLNAKSDSIEISLRCFDVVNDSLGLLQGFYKAVAFLYGSFELFEIALTIRRFKALFLIFFFILY